MTDEAAPWLDAFGLGDAAHPTRSSPLRLLTFSTLFPHAGRPNQGIFVENRLRHLVAGGEATSFVLAPVPWFPSRARLFGDWTIHAGAPQAETRHGIAIRHPRYKVIPKAGM